MTLSLFTKSEGGGAKHSPSDVTSGDLCDRASEASSTIKLMMQIQRYTPKHIIAMDKQLSSSLKNGQSQKVITPRMMRQQPAIILDRI